MERQRTGADELRLIVRNMNGTRGDFNDRFTAEQIVQLFRMQLACGWDFMPDTWTERQVAEALAGKPPQWDDNERPVYEDPAHMETT